MTVFSVTRKLRIIEERRQDQFVCSNEIMGQSYYPEKSVLGPSLGKIIYVVRYLSTLGKRNRVQNCLFRRGITEAKLQTREVCWV